MIGSPLASARPVYWSPATVSAPRQKTMAQAGFWAPFGLTQAASVTVFVLRLHCDTVMREVPVFSVKPAALLAAANPGKLSAEVGPAVPEKPFCTPAP